MLTFNLRVLVLENHTFQRSIAVAMLQHMGCAHVFQAAEGCEAIELLKQIGSVDIVLCNFYMNDIDGLEFLSSVDALGLVKSVIISSSISAELLMNIRQFINVLDMHLLGSISNPIQYGDLKALLRKHLSIPGVNMTESAPVNYPDEEEVCSAFARGEFVSYFQPKCDLRTGEFRGVEVLTRWQHPSKGMLYPPSFMQVLERCGLLNELLFSQVKQSLALQSHLKIRGHSVNYALNVMASQLSDGSLSMGIKKLLSTYAAAGSGLTFELTESGSLEINRTTLKCLIHLRMMGCRLSIDDFGMGFSSMHRLCQLPFTEIKVDREFTKRFLVDDRSKAIINSTLALGKTLGMTVVIEGVETEEQRLQLVELGCTQGQGFLYARPMSAFHFAQWLSDRKSSLQGDLNWT